VISAASMFRDNVINLRRRLAAAGTGVAVTLEDSGAQLSPRMPVASRRRRRPLMLPRASPMYRARLGIADEHRTSRRRARPSRSPGAHSGGLGHISRHWRIWDRRSWRHGWAV